MSLDKSLSDPDHEILTKDRATQKYLQLDQKVSKAIAQSVDEAPQLKVSMLDVVRLKDDQVAAIVEVFSERDFLADVGSSPKDWETIYITLDDIKAIVWRAPAAEQIETWEK